MLADQEPSLPAPGDLLAGIGIRAYGTLPSPPRVSVGAWHGPGRTIVR
jgi:hypothetical protein